MFGINNWLRLGSTKPAFLWTKWTLRSDKFFRSFFSFLLSSMSENRWSVSSRPTLMQNHLMVKRENRFISASCIFIVSKHFKSRTNIARLVDAPLHTFLIYRFKCCKIDLGHFFFYPENAPQHILLQIWIFDKILWDTVDFSHIFRSLSC